MSERIITVAKPTARAPDARQRRGRCCSTTRACSAGASVVARAAGMGNRRRCRPAQPALSAATRARSSLRWSTCFATAASPTISAVTLWRIFAGSAVAVVLGVATRRLDGDCRNACARYADIYIAALYPLPKVTLIPLLIIWLGTGGPFMLTISALGAIFPVIINTVLGVRQCDPGLVLAARDLGAAHRQIIATGAVAERHPVDLRRHPARARRVDHSRRRGRNGGRQSSGSARGSISPARFSKPSRSSPY